MLSIKQRDVMRVDLQQVDGGIFREGADMPPVGMAKAISDFRLCLDDLDTNDVTIVQLKELVENRNTAIVAWADRVESIQANGRVKDERIAELEKERKLLGLSCNSWHSQLNTAKERIAKLESECMLKMGFKPVAATLPANQVEQGA